MTRLLSCPTCGVTTATNDSWSSGQCDSCFDAETQALARAYIAKPHSRWRQEMWAYRVAFVIGGVLLLWVSFTDKRQERVPTAIDPCALVVTADGARCR